MLSVGALQYNHKFETSVKGFDKLLAMNLNEFESEKKAIIDIDEYGLGMCNVIQQEFSLLNNWK
ncbi:23210_t:CDS:2 [Cetraspora pellucida]|uniref:23210_t:CDS:1 n=1 Tax=Cetraspora pellucida TaxID=1433469 RepID=A0A9N8W4L7_9GLOM|nr:23210_t:CDS:2 [Cetraspora pellucida]